MIRSALNCLRRDHSPNLRINKCRRQPLLQSCVNKIITKMTRDKIRAKVLTLIEQTPFQPLPTNHSYHNGPRAQPCPSTSKTSISRQSYMHSPEPTDSKNLKNSSVSLTRSKKKRYLNMVSDPRQQSLQKLRKENIVLNHNKLKISRVSRQNTGESRVEGKLAGNCTSCSLVSLEAKDINVRPAPAAPQIIIVKEKIVPILIQPAQPAQPPFFKKQNAVLNRHPLKIEHINHHLNALHQTTSAQLHQQVHLRAQPKSNLQSHQQSCILPPYRPQQTSNSHNMSTEFFIPVNQAVLPRPVNHSPTLSHVQATPIRAYSPSQKAYTPSQKTYTPIHLIQRSSLEKTSSNFNQHIILKLGSTELQNQVLLHSQNYLQPTQHQMALKIISDSASISPYPVFRTISKRPLIPNHAHSPDRNVSNTKVTFYPASTPKRQVQLASCQIPAKFINTPSKIAKMENQHQIKHSPKPVKQRQLSIKLDQDSNFRRQSQKSNKNQTFKLEISSNSHQAIAKSSFFGQSKIQNAAMRQNNFLASMRYQIDQLDSKRKESESRISKRLSELSERTSSIVKSYQNGLRSPVNKQVLGSSRSNLLKQSFCKQNELKLNFSVKSSLQISTRDNKQNQQQGVNLREQIMSRIFS